MTPPSSPVLAPALLRTAQGVLRLLQARLGFETVLLAAKQADQYVVLAVEDTLFGLTPGPQGAWSASLCDVMSRSLTPGPVAVDVLAEFGYRHAAERSGLPVRCYVGVALRGADGTLLGSLCALSDRPGAAAAVEQERDLLVTLADLVGQLVAPSLPGGGAAVVLPAPAPRRPADEEVGAGERADVDEQVRGLLRRVRTLFGLEAAFVSRLADGVQTFTHLDSDGPFPVREGDQRPLEATLCQRVLDGRLPTVLTDARRHPDSRDVDVVRAGLVATYLTVPVHLPDGRRYGTLCCLSSSPRADLSEDAAAALSFAAQEVGVLVGRRLAAAAGRDRALRRLDLLLRGDALAVVLQPVVDLATGAAVGSEALARFPDGRGPSAWFAEATRYGQGVRLELAALELALAEQPWGSGPTPFLAVNLSASALLTQDLQRRLGALLHDDPARLRSLVVEVTEHEQVRDYHRLDAALAPWRSAGVRLSIDDTGAGHSSLAHVLRLQPDFVKLDRDMVTALDRDPVRRDLVRRLQQFCDDRCIELIAEGVETAGEARALRDVGVRLAQGFHYGRPLSAARDLPG